MRTTYWGFALAVVSSLFVTALLTSGPAWAADPVTKVALRAPSVHGSPFELAESNDLVLGAPPRESADEAKAIYGPVAEYLSTVLNRRVVFHPAGNWGVYQGLMQKGAYDLEFDGPHFTSWRTENTGHTALLKVPGDFVFVVLVKKNNDKIHDMQQLAGRAVCAHAPPNLGTLTVLNEFTNPARQPLIINTNGWKNIYQGLLDDKCVAAAVPVAKLEQFEKTGGRQTRIIFRGAALPDNALSAGPRIKAGDQQKIVQALLSPEGERVTARLRNKYAAGKSFIRTNNKEFAGLSVYLKNEWGY